MNQQSRIPGWNVLIHNITVYSGVRTQRKIIDCDVGSDGYLEVSLHSGNMLKSLLLPRLIWPPDRTS